MTYKNLLFLLFFLFNIVVSCNSKNKNRQPDFGKVEISNERITRFTNQDKYFSCDNQNRKNTNEPISKFSKIILKENQLAISNTDNSYSEGCKIDILVDNELKIVQIEFNQWFDVIDESYETRYEVIECYMNLNKNPFSGPKEKIVGNYYLKIKDITDYNLFWKKDKVDVFSFKGRFVCAKDLW